MNALGRLIIALVATGVAAWAAAPTLGQEADPGQPDSDPPSRAARLSYLEGSVSLQPAGVEDWNAAPLNQPLTAGDALWSDSGSHAEADLGSAVVRLDENSSVALLDLSDQGVQLRVSAGAVDVDVNALDADEAFEIDAPNAAVLLLRAGKYRLSIDSNGNTSVDIRSGQARVASGDQQPMTLVTGQHGLYSDNGSYAVTHVGPPDDFDRWCQQRQVRWADQQQAAAQYVSTDVVGYEDLNDNGQWQTEPDYGNVWFPAQVSADWAPYSAGHWVWVAPWGWSWVDDAPWGFAPFHYGRWGHFGRRWGWIPAPPHRHAIYAPALVAWVGGSAVSLGGGAAVGWLPLAPGEVYVPAYRVSPRYLQNVNTSNTNGLNAADVINVSRNPGRPYRYANRVVPSALTVVPQVNFSAGQPVARHTISAPPQFAAATLSARTPTIIPGRESVLGPVALGHVSRPPAAILGRPVMTRRQPPPAAPRFEVQQSAIRANGGSPLDAGQLQHLRAQDTPVVRPMPAASASALPERAPQFQASPQAMGPNVFQRRDRELQQQHEQRQQQQQQFQLQQQQRPQHQ
ncbi:MAG TPA: DUF6600 domain-containing protein, partial [Steroidobacteraceae bacterium]